MRIRKGEKEMENRLSMVEARNSLTTLPERFAEDSSINALVVTRRGNPVLAILPWEVYDSLMETVRIMADPQLIADLREGIAAIQAGDTVDWDDFKRELGY